MRVYVHKNKPKGSPGPRRTWGYGKIADCHCFWIGPCIVMVFT